MRLAIATDAWFPQVNGVVRTLSTTIDEVRRRGHAVTVVSPRDFVTVPMPGYAQIRLAVTPRFGLRRQLDAFAPDIVHIATEGPIGWSARRYCLTRGLPFTTAFHTRFPDYAAVRTGLSAERFWPIMRRFHAPSRAVLVATRSLAAELQERGIGPTCPWSRGIDQALFRSDGPRHPALADLPRPVLLTVGRLAPEKNVAAFLDLALPGSKVVVGDGPSLDDLRRRFPATRFLGALSGEALAAAYRGADAFVFPSRTDTFGLVVIEALASGTPVAAYPVPGPVDILGRDGRGDGGDLTGPAGALDDDLAGAIARALEMDGADAARLGARYAWSAATDQFLAAVETAWHAAGEQRRARVA